MLHHNTASVIKGNPTFSFHNHLFYKQENWSQETVNNSSGLFQTSKEDDIKSHCSYLSWLMNEVRDRLPHFTLWNNQVFILKFAFISISSQEQPDSCIILWSRRKGKSCEGGWKREGWSGWEAKPWKDTPWTLKKQWVLGPTGLIQPQEIDHYHQLCLCKGKSWSHKWICKHLLDKGTDLEVYIYAYNLWRIHTIHILEALDIFSHLVLTTTLG